MKINLKIVLTIFLIICNLFIFTTCCFANIEPESLDSKYGLQTDDSYWNVEVFAKNVIISFVMIIAIIIILKIIMRTNENRIAKLIHRIISVILIISYIIFGIIMFGKMLEKNENYVKYYGIPYGYAVNYGNIRKDGETYYTYDQIYEYLTKLHISEKPSTAKNYLKYEEINVNIIINTKEFSFENTYSPKIAKNTLLDIMRTNLSRNRKYVIKIETKEQNISSITISDKWIIQKRNNL